jgi:hypothetical protein
VRVAVLWSLLAIANLTYLVMLATLQRSRPRRIVELAWAVVPWLITALCAGPTVRHILETDQRTNVPMDAAIIAPAPVVHPHDPAS